MQVFLGIVFPYLALLVFWVGLVWRTWSWLARPLPFSVTLDLPGERRSGTAAAVVRELLLFNSLWRGDRLLWLAGWLMHAALVVIVVGHVVGIAALKQQFTWFGATPELSLRLSAIFGTTCGLLFVAALLALLLRRVSRYEVRYLSTGADYFELVLLLWIAISGLWLRWTSDAADLAATRAYLAGLLTLRPSLPPPGRTLLVHFTLVNVLLLCLPFSKLVHLTGTAVGRSLLARSAPVYPTPAGWEPVAATEGDRAAFGGVGEGCQGAAGKVVAGGERS